MLKTLSSQPDVRIAMFVHWIFFIVKEFCLIVVINPKETLITKQLQIFTTVGAFQVLIINLGMFIFFEYTLICNDAVQYNNLFFSYIVLYSYELINCIQIIYFFIITDVTIFWGFIIVGISASVIEVFYIKKYQKVLWPISMHLYTQISSDSKIIHAYMQRKKVAAARNALIILFLINLGKDYITLALKDIYPELQNPDSLQGIYKGIKSLDYTTSNSNIIINLMSVLISVVLMTMKLEEESKTHYILIMVFLIFGIFSKCFEIIVQFKSVSFLKSNFLNKYLTFFYIYSLIMVYGDYQNLGIGLKECLKRLKHKHKNYKKF
ncbi:hypothetical protein NUSPORA_01814 [Nucleospora cyclopteri]